VRTQIDAGATEIDHRGPLGPNVSIFLIGRLDNMDKHRLLLPQTPVSPWSEPTLRGVKRASGRYPGDWIRLEDGAELFRITELEVEPGVTDVTVDRPMRWTILFGDPVFDIATSLWTDSTKGAMSAADMRIAAEHIQAVLDGFDRNIDPPGQGLGTP